MFLIFIYFIGILLFIDIVFRTTKGIRFKALMMFLFFITLFFGNWVGSDYSDIKESQAKEEVFLNTVDAKIYQPYLILIDYLSNLASANNFIQLKSALIELHKQNQGIHNGQEWMESFKENITDVIRK